jgi:hypothetical protein
MTRCVCDPLTLRPVALVSPRECFCNSGARFPESEYFVLVPVKLGAFTLTRTLTTEWLSGPARYPARVADHGNERWLNGSEFARELSDCAIPPLTGSPERVPTSMVHAVRADGSSACDLTGLHVFDQEWSGAVYGCPKCRRITGTGRRIAE